MTGFIKVHEYITYLRYHIRVKRNSALCDYLNSLQILRAEDTIKTIINENLSVSRYGDGEFDVMTGGANGFQQKNDNLGSRLREILTNPVKGHLVCIPYTLIDLSIYRISSRIFALEYLYRFTNEWLKPFVDTDRIYGDSLFTRFYMMRKDKSHCTEYVQQLKKIWDQKDLLIVEGEHSRLGVGNDLFANANSIERILCPDKNAFDKYDEIFEASKKYGRGKLILIALGMTATVLAYDLAKRGYRSIDVGHVDIEYMWMLMGAKEKCSVPGKNVNEVGKNMEINGCNHIEYINSIITKIEQ